MGTRSLTVFNDSWNDEEIAVFYRQFDGYPAGYGTELLNFLRDMHIVNGMNSDNMKLKIANGMDCLAAQVVADFKEGPGDFYLHKSGTRDVGGEYIYTLYTKNNELQIKVEDTYEDEETGKKGHELFNSSIEDYREWINEEWT